MSITDGLQHYGEVAITDDINYYHTGLGKRVNKMLKGFLTGGRLYLENEGWVSSSFYNTSVRRSNNAIAISPFYGVFYAIGGGNVHVVSKDLTTVIASFSTPITNSGGAATIDGKGNGLIVTNQKFYHVYPNGTIKNEASHNLNATNEEFSFVAVNQKKDTFYFSLYSGAGRRAYFGKLSTLEIKNTFTRSVTEKSYFMKDGRLVVKMNASAGISAYTIDYENYSILSTNSITLPFTGSKDSFLGLTKDGKALLHDASGRKLYSVDFDNGTVTTLIAQTPVGIEFCDFDNKYLYGQHTTNNTSHVCDFNTGAQITSVNSGTYKAYPYPMQLRGKMPICEDFF